MSHLTSLYLPRTSLGASAKVPGLHVAATAVSAPWEGGEGRGARGARPPGTPDAAFRRQWGGAAGEGSTGALLSAEHTEFTWDQKTWEDRLIQVEAGWGRWGQLCGFGVGGVQEPLGDTSPSCLKTWGAQAAAAGGPSLEAKAPEAAEGGPSRSPQARTAPASCRKGDASRDGGRRWRGRVTAPGAQPSGALPTCAFFPRPQFLRDSLRTPRGSSWSLRLSKELNNQMQSFDSPSLEKVGPQRQGRADREGLRGQPAGGQAGLRLPRSPGRGDGWLGQTRRL